jgi:hypothetical protein
MKVEDLSNVFLRALFYGESGAGKTRLLGTAMQCPETTPMLVLNARGQPISLRFLGDNVPLILSIERMTDFNDIYAWTMDDQPLAKPLRQFVSDDVIVDAGGWDAECAALPEPWSYVYRYLARRGALKFRTLAIDSITQVQRIANDVIVKYNDDSYSPVDVPARRGYPEYQTLLDMMTKFADHHYKLPVHILMTALCRHSEMPTLGITKYYPFLWGQGSLEVPSYAELVGRLVNIESLAIQRINAMTDQFTPAFQGEQPFNVLYTSGGRDFVAKWQGPTNAPDLVINPTIRKLLDVIEGVVPNPTPAQGAGTSRARVVSK